MYKQIKSYFTNEIDTQQVLRIADNATIPFDPQNSDYQQYLKWVAEGNQPEPADE